MRNFTLLSIIIFLISLNSYSKNNKTQKDTIFEKTFSSLKWRSIGPAFTSGRIADFAVDPNNYAHYYVAVASGHVWETKNNGITYKPIFDHHHVYSIGCVSIAPSQPNIVWIGTGENNHQREIGYGNGVYKSTDGGKTWKNMGLKNSRQIGDIIINPKNPDIVYVAAEGSIWTPNKERGVFKTTDGGKTWKKVLFVSENTGVANICFDPKNPNIIYAGAEQRRRKQYTKIGGGPESAYYKSIDGGKTWEKLTNGIPSVDKGGMEIKVSPVNSNYVYAMFQATEKGGFYRSTNGGASFEKMSDYYSSGQYFSEIYCSPFNKDKVYSVDTYSRYTMDGGKTWTKIPTKTRHVDDHAMWLDPKNPLHYNIGCDGGIYETWDGGKTFIHKTTLPVVQFYRVSVDNTKPFYWVYGGTQDNNSIGGPSRNLKRGGVGSDEWITTLGGDGFWQDVEKDNPNIVYSAYQYGNIYRYDKKSGERIKIRPEPKKDELTFRWNWNAPFLLSNFDKKTIYIAANKVFKSVDRGNSWKEISNDLTRNEDRNQFKVMGKYWPSDAVAKDVSTSQWGTIVSLAESPVKQGLIYVGTDDGLIQVTEDDGKTWQKISTFPNVPKYTYVSDIYASPFDENLVFASFNNIKNDDFKPYLFKSTDKGKTWVSISANLPDSETVHCVLQDYKNKNLLFAGTEFGIYFSPDLGKNWAKLGSGLPDIPVRDIKIQKDQNDLVIATFGRGFYILDDYSALQLTTKEDLQKKAIMYPVKDALMYIQKDDRYGVGDAVYKAKNPDFGAIFTYYIKDVPKTLKQIRKQQEKKLFKDGKPIPQPTQEQLNKEKQQEKPYLVFTIRNENNEIVRKIYKKASKGINRASWNLRYSLPSPTSLSNNKFKPTKKQTSGVLALPGKYSVQLSMIFNGKQEKLTEPVYFNAKLLNNSTLPLTDNIKLKENYDKMFNVYNSIKSSELFLKELKTKINYIRQSINLSNKSNDLLLIKAKNISNNLDSLNFVFYGQKAKASWEEIPPAIEPINVRLNEMIWASWESKGEITQTQINNLKILQSDIKKIISNLKLNNEKINNLNKELDKINAPYTPGRIPEIK